uniref:DUF2470 domain-containing protein n=1 Tax=Macrostomum lignano TaxID=282301 RepID=A0A1I8F3J9_9PLAT
MLASAPAANGHPPPCLANPSFPCPPPMGLSPACLPAASPERLAASGAAATGCPLQQGTLATLGRGRPEARALSQSGPWKQQTEWSFKNQVTARKARLPVLDTATARGLAALFTPPATAAARTTSAASRCRSTAAKPMSIFKAIGALRPCLPSKPRRQHFGLDTKSTGQLVSCGLRRKAALAARAAGARLRLQRRRRASDDDERRDSVGRRDRLPLGRTAVPKFETNAELVEHVNELHVKNCDRKEFACLLAGLQPAPEALQSASDDDGRTGRAADAIDCGWPAAGGEAAVAQHQQLHHRHHHHPGRLYGPMKDGLIKTEALVSPMVYSDRPSPMSHISQQSSAPSPQSERSCGSSTLVGVACQASTNGPTGLMAPPTAAQPDDASVVSIGSPLAAGP